jgi:hypothetical protein
MFISKAKVVAGFSQNQGKQHHRLLHARCCVRMLTWRVLSQGMAWAPTR